MPSEGTRYNFGAMSARCSRDDDEARPWSVSREFGFSMHTKSKLRPFVEAMLGVPLFDKEADNFDFESLLGQECLLERCPRGEERQHLRNIAGASPLPRGMDAPALVNEKKMIDLNTAPFEEIEELPSFIREKMQSSDEFKGRIQHAENIAGGPRAHRPARASAELAADEDITVEDEPAF